MEDPAARDRRLVRSILQGDTDAFGELVVRYQRLVASAAWRYGVASEEVEDVVSEVFAKAFRNVHRYRPEHPFSTWLYRLAVNHVIDHGRRTRRDRQRMEMPQQVVDASPGPAEGLESRERIALVRGALAEVPDHYREALFLVYVEGMKLDDAARMLGLRQGTIKTRLMRGRAALRKILVRRHPEHFGG
jgi:RNA polymerase sigma-70 factor (ECF subfamily)